MAGQQRNTTFIQGSTRPIAQVALYARVSTLAVKTPKCNSANSGTMQGAGWQIVEEYIDKGVSGSKEWRPRSIGCCQTPDVDNLTPFWSGR